MRQIIFILLLFSNSVIGQTNNKYIIGKSDSLYSNTLKENRQIIVYVPYNNNPFIQKINYPVLYLLDGEEHFIKVVGIMEHLSGAFGNESCPKMIIVGIIHTQRTKELLPIISENNNSFENTDDFTTFMEKELIPYIDKNYPTESYRLLLGHSLGGLRAVNTLVYHPQLFNSYIALDPSLGQDLNVWSNKTNELMKNKVFNNKSLFIAMAQTMPLKMDTLSIQNDTSGASRHMRSIMRFSKAINKQKNKGLNFAWKYYPNETHSSVSFLGTYEGLNSIFSWYKNQNQNDIYEKSTSINSSVEVVTKHFEMISEQMNYKVSPPEQYINEIIDNLLQKGMIEKAIAFCELNAKKYPSSQQAKFILNNQINNLKWGDKKSLKNLLISKTSDEVYNLCKLEIKKKEPEYNISETAINELGYSLLNEKKPKDAILFFKLNIELNPNSANAFDSYGECLLLLGNEKDGLAAYKKSLDLDSNNSNAESILKKYNYK